MNLHSLIEKIATEQGLAQHKKQDKQDIFLDKSWKKSYIVLLLLRYFKEKICVLTSVMKMN